MLQAYLEIRGVTRTEHIAIMMSLIYGNNIFSFWRPLKIKLKCT